MSEQTTTPPAWVNDLPEDMRGNAAVASFKGNEWKEVGPAIFKSFIETKAMTGRKAYDLPKDDWKPEQWGEWNKVLGVPDSPDKYGAPPEEMLTKAGLNKDVLSAAQKRFHELGLTPRQVKGIMDEWYLPTAIQGSEARAKQEQDERAASSAKLENDLKLAYGDKTDAKKGLVKAFLSKFGNDELIEWAEKTGAGNDPGFVKALIKASEALLEDSSARGGSGAGLGPEASKATALKEIDAMIAQRINDKDFAARFEDPRSAERQKWDQLHQLAYKQAQGT